MRHLHIELLVFYNTEADDGEMTDLIKRLGAALARRHRKAMGTVTVCEEKEEDLKMKELN